MGKNYLFVCVLAFTVALLSGLDFQYYFPADKTTIVAENARTFLTLALIAWCFLMTSGVASLLIGLLYLCGAPVDEHANLHDALAVLWCLSFILIMVGEIEVVKRDKADGCYDHDPITWKGPTCVSSSDWGMIGSYVATALAFILA
ncbi:hypothetical protein ACJ41O_000341 [Fusarium nematophilum]